MLEANDMVEAKLAEIRERKLHEMKRMFAAKMDEALGGMSKAEMKAREDAGFVRASAPKEKGGLGPSSYDIGQEKSKGRLLKAAAKKKKKVAEETLDEMRAPGEIPGSEERKQDAAKLRAARSGLKALDVGKEHRQKFTKDYLSARRAQMASGASASQKEPDAAPEAKTDPHAKGWSDLASKLDRNQKQQPRRDKFLKSGRLFKFKLKQGIDKAKTAVKKDILSGGPIKRVAKAPVVQDLKNIGFRNL